MSGMAKLAIDGGIPVRKEKIPLYKPWFGVEEINAAVESIKSGKVGGDGPRGKELENEICGSLGVKNALLTTSCTAALELALMALEVGVGDEIICPSFTFTSTANAIARCGARPVFVDIRKDTYTIDPDEIEKVLTPRTKAIIPVHYAGQACDMDEICAIAKENNLKIVEDAAHAIGAKYKDEYLGTIGDIGCFSFHETKNVVCGEGGALATNDEAIARRVEIMREKGTNKSAFLRGENPEYSWIDIGSSYVLSDVLAAIALEQFRKLNKMIELNNKNATYLSKKLGSLADKIVLPHIEDEAQTNWHIYPVRVPKEKRDWIIRALNAEGMGAAFHYVPLHSSPYGKGELGYKEGDFPVTEEVSQTLIRLPMYPQLTEEDLDDIALAVKKVLVYGREFAYE